MIAADMIGFMESIYYSVLPNPFKTAESAPHCALTAITWCLCEGNWPWDPLP